MSDNRYALDPAVNGTPGVPAIANRMPGAPEIPALPENNELATVVKQPWDCDCLGWCCGHYPPKAAESYKLGTLVVRGVALPAFVAG